LDLDTATGRDKAAANPALPSPTGAASASAHEHLERVHRQFFMHAHCNVAPPLRCALGAHRAADGEAATPRGAAAQRAPLSWHAGLRALARHHVCAAPRM
jgi:hypothetical protein